MKRSTAITLVLSGALTTGCGRQPTSANGDWSYGAGGDQPITNNTYVPGYGYWHAPYRSWYPYPYNFYRPGWGYYHGGSFSSDPEIIHVFSSRPGFSHEVGMHVSRGGFGRSASGRS